MAGSLVSLDKIDDPIFSKKLMGDGIVIIPTEGNVYAPANGEVIVLPTTNHAIGIKTTNGVEILIHIGFDSESLTNEIKSHVKIGQQINRGDLLLSFDLDELKNIGYRNDTSIIITNSNEYIDIIKSSKESILIGENLFVII